MAAGLDGFGHNLHRMEWWPASVARLTWCVVEMQRYNGLNLVVGDLGSSTAVHVSNRGGGGVQRLGPGVHGVSNGHMGASGWPKVRSGDNKRPIPGADPANSLCGRCSASSATHRKSHRRLNGSWCWCHRCRPERLHCSGCWTVRTSQVGSCRGTASSACWEMRSGRPRLTSPGQARRFKHCTVSHSKQRH